MSLVLITGVPGTGKTAFLVAELLKIAAAGRTIFVDNVPGLKLPHYRAGSIPAWQTGTWLHIDRYIRTTPSVAAPVKNDIENNESDGNENWQPLPDVHKDDDGNLFITSFDAKGQPDAAVPYENHKGALLVIDECQRHFRPRPAGSVVPDHVAALEVHRHQGLDIWLVTQRPGLVDANVRALCDKHIALRKTPFGRYKYEWSEVGDIESKFSRDTAAKSRYKLPNHVFSLYKSAEVHNVTSHKLPLVAKVFLLCVPVLAFLGWSSYRMISKKLNPEPVTVANSDHGVQKASFNQHLLSGKDVHASGLPSGLIAAGFEPYTVKPDLHHPYEGGTLEITGRVRSSKYDRYLLIFTSASGAHVPLSSADLLAAGYSISDSSDCSFLLSYKQYKSFVTCGSGAVSSPSVPAAIT